MSNAVHFSPIPLTNGPSAPTGAVPIATSGFSASPEVDLSAVAEIRRDLEALIAARVLPSIIFAVGGAARLAAEARLSGRERQRDLIRRHPVLDDSTETRQ